MASVYQRKTDGRWIICFTDLDGRRKTRSLRTTKKREADAAAASIIRNLAEGRAGIVSPKHVSFADFAAFYLDTLPGRVAPSWIARQRRTLQRFIVPFFKNRYVHTISAEDIGEYFRHEQKGRPISGRTMNLELAILRVLFKTAKKRGVILGNPTADFQKFRETPGKIHYLDREEVARLRAAAASAATPYLPLVVDLGLFAGLRKGEILNLPKDNITPEQVTVSNLQHWTTKSKKNRTIPLNSILRQTYLRHTPHLHCKTLIWQKNGLRVKDVKKAISWAYRAAGIPKEKRGCHILRHTFAMMFLEAGGDIKTLCDLMGHSSIAVTEKYLHARPTEVKKQYLERMVLAEKCV